MTKLSSTIAVCLVFLAVGTSPAAVDVHQSAELDGFSQPDVHHSAAAPKTSLDPSRSVPKLRQPPAVVTRPADSIDSSEAHSDANVNSEVRLAKVQARNAADQTKGGVLELGEAHDNAAVDMQAVQTAHNSSELAKRRLGEDWDGAAQARQGPVGYCPKECKNGGTLQNCKCTCVEGWGGRRCSKCRILPGNGRRLLQAPDEEEDMEESEIEEMRQKRHLEKHPPPLGKCQHGTLNPTACNCNCPPSWKGLLCDGCVHPPCQNGGVLDKTTCSCKCAGYWTGKTCTECTISGMMPWGKLFSRTTDQTLQKCYHGDFIASECRCDCDVNWGGDFCNQCKHDDCGVHGLLDPLVCRCDCVRAWVGKVCQKCTHKFCKFSTRYPKSACDWVKKVLHCPGEGQPAAMPELRKLPHEPQRSGSSALVRTMSEL